MAKIRIERVIETLSSDIRHALRDAVKEVIPDATFDDHELFRAFRRAVGRKCSTWEKVPDDLVESDQ